MTYSSASLPGLKRWVDSVFTLSCALVDLCHTKSDLFALKQFSLVGKCSVTTCGKVSVWLFLCVYLMKSNPVTFNPNVTAQLHPNLYELSKVFPFHCTLSWFPWALIMRDIRVLYSGKWMWHHAPLPCKPLPFLTALIRPPPRPMRWFPSCCTYF